MQNILDPGFAGDDGAADAELADALAAYSASDADHRHVLRRLQHARLLVPVVAMLGEVEYDGGGLAHDKSSDMATVLMQGRDGRLALLAFTSTESMRSWNPAARPVPVTTATAAASAVQDNAAALLLDVAGPVMFVVEGADLQALADGYVLTSIGDTAAWVKAGGGRQD